MHDDIKNRLSLIEKRQAYHEDLMITLTSFLRETYVNLDHRTCQTLSMMTELIKRTDTKPEPVDPRERLRSDFELFMQLPREPRYYIFSYLRQPEPRVPGAAYNKYGTKAFDYPEFVQLLSELPDRCIM